MSMNARIRWVVGAALLLVYPRPVNACPDDTRPDDTRLARLIRDLNHDRYHVREQATRALESMGDLPGPALRMALENPPSLEARRRIERLLAKRAKFHADRARADARAWELARHLLQAFQA